jgi:MurNAc alpha-1-phosphate uridylyltransferase
MKAMILAAGFGERMRPLTDHTPKPLLRVADVPLIDYHIRALAAAGFTELVINVSHLAQQIVEHCGDGSRWGLSIAYSREHEPLETAGGIHRALPLLGEQPFLVINADVWIDYSFDELMDYRFKSWESAHLVMVDNPPQHPLGDFCLGDDGVVQYRPVDSQGYTYSGVGVFSADFFAAMSLGKLPLRPLLDDAIGIGCLSAEYYPGDWQDVGTPERLAALDVRVRSVIS